VIGLTVSHYRIDEKIGEGGMGVVYKAQDLRLDRSVALKFLPRHLIADQRVRDRFFHEARAASALDHPNICVIHEIGETESGELFIAMTHYSGKTLAKKLERGPLPIPEAMDIAAQVARGLAKAHERGIIHRDIKPANLMITEEGLVKILDFGVAKLSGATRLTRTGSAVGTVAYMSPEQAARDEATPQSDVWSVGALLYEMLTGQLPFQGGSPIAVLYSILYGEPDPLRGFRGEVTPALDRIVSRALAKDLGTRYPGMRPLFLDLESLVGETVAATVPRPETSHRLAAEGPSAAPMPFLTPESRSSGETAILPFVGRAAELATFRGWLRDAQAGRGRVGFVTGDAGTGKTALVREFCRRASAEDPLLIVATGTCNAHTGAGDSYRPFREILAQVTGDVEAQWAAGSVSAEHATRLWSLLPASIAALLETGPDLVGTFLPAEGILDRAQADGSLTSRQLDRLRALAERESLAGTLQQRDLFGQYVRLLRRLAGERSLLLVVDDLQWSDAGSVSLLFELSRHLSGVPILLLGMYRSAEVATGRDGARHPLESVVHELSAILGDVNVTLDSAGDRRFVDALIDADPNHLGEDFRAALFSRTRGHALFTVELLRGLKDAGLLALDASNHWVEGTGKIEWRKLPARVEAVIGERIARVRPALQRLLTVASVEGERFTLEAVARVLGTEVRELIHPISQELEKQHQLVVADGIERVDGQRLSVYRFRHILFQRFLYERLDLIEHSYLHEQIGSALEELHRGRTEEIALELAHHFQKADRLDKAADLFFVAGDRADRVLGRAEALAHFRSALNAVLALPPSPERARQELEVQTRLGWSLHFLGAPGQIETFSRARDLAEEVGSGLELFWPLIGLFVVTHWAGDHRWGMELAEKCLSLALTEGDPALIGPAHESVGRNAMLRGDFSRCRHNYEATLQVDYDAKKHPDPRYMLGLEVSSVALGMLGWCLWYLGYPDQALERCREGVAMAKKVENPISLWFVVAYETWVSLLRRDVQAVRAKIDAIRRAASEGGTTMLSPGILLTAEGWCRVQEGDVEGGRESVRLGWEDVKAKNQGLAYSWCSLRMAEALLAAGRAGGSLAVLEEARALSAASDEHINESELLRLQGESLLLLDVPRHQDAEEAFRKAMEIAGRQEAKSWELRAATSLGYLLRDTGRSEEALSTLGEVYGWFSEGFDTADLKEARNLLRELESR
jgi:tetratricopeptide (TPR) repeat protein